MVDTLVLLDSSVLINILATQQATEVLRVFRAGVGICAAVEGETLFLRSDDPTTPVERISLDSLLADGLLQRHDLRDEAEQALYVELAADLDDGEAMTIAIAHQRGFAAATDDRKARRIAKQRFGDELVLLRTTDVIHYWAAIARPPKVTLRDLLRRIERIACYVPAKDDPLREWWADVTT